MANFKKIEQLWSAADNLRVNTGLTAQEYFRPILVLIFLLYAEYRFIQAKVKLELDFSRRRASPSKGGIKSHILAEGAMHVPDDVLLRRYCLQAVHLSEMLDQFTSVVRLMFNSINNIMLKNENPHKKMDAQLPMLILVKYHYENILSHF